MEIIGYGRISKVIETLRVYLGLSTVRQTDSDIVVEDKVSLTFDIKDQLPNPNWVTGLAVADGAVVIPKKANKKFIIKHVMLWARNVALDTGERVGIVATIGGVTSNVVEILLVPSSANARDLNMPCQIECDVNTDITSDMIGVMTVKTVVVMGYYINDLERT